MPLAFSIYTGFDTISNIEGTAIGGVDFFPDEHYCTWPALLNDREMASGEFLKSLSPADELALFLLNRGACLAANGQHPEALTCYAEAHRLMPDAVTPVLALRSALVSDVPRKLAHTREQSAVCADKPASSVD